MALDPVIAGHPLHPAIISVPVGLFPASYVLDILAMTTGSDALAEAAYYDLLIGYVGAAAALSTGYLDYRQMAPNDPANTIAKTHGIINASLAGIYALNILVRRNNKRSKVGFLLSTLGTVGLMISGYLGGEIAYGRGWRVRPLERFELEWQKIQKVGLFNPKGAQEAGKSPTDEEYPVETIKSLKELKSGEAVLKDVQKDKYQSSFDKIMVEASARVNNGTISNNSKMKNSSTNNEKQKATEPVKASSEPTKPSPMDDKPSQAEGERDSTASQEVSNTRTQNVQAATPSPVDDKPSQAEGERE